MIETTAFTPYASEPISALLIRKLSDLVVKLKGNLDTDDESKHQQVIASELSKSG